LTYFFFNFQTFKGFQQGKKYVNHPNYASIFAPALDYTLGAVVLQVPRLLLNALVTTLIGSYKYAILKTNAYEKEFVIKLLLNNRN
jgi:hypothetical protein